MTHVVKTRPRSVHWRLAVIEFQTTIGDIQKQMNENYEKNNKLREENIELASKLKNLIEQYELREQVRILDCWELIATFIVPKQNGSYLVHWSTLLSQVDHLHKQISCNLNSFTKLNLFNHHQEW